MRKTLGILIIALVVGVIGIIFFYNLTHESSFSDQELRHILDGYLQTMSAVKPFAYEVKSLKNATASPDTYTWCAQISPPLVRSAAPNINLPEIQRFIISYRPDSQWNTLLIGNTERDIQIWTETGCNS